ncbi:MAG: iron chelate uptake ABC transporter family permease subunit [Spirochaetes bacterium]|jgi:iron complex transport system permease protein|nr:iron chelate uptake ABC transporter family permease subunit [Spirochaetota bacterium]
MWLLFVLVFFSLAISLLVGRFPAPGLSSPAALLATETSRAVFLHLRLPRVLTAALLGASLAASGCAFQMLFRNPLVEPGFLGVTQGAAFGAALAILVLPGVVGAVQISAVIFATAGLFLSYGVARRLRFGGWVIRMIISGIAVSALFASGLGILKYLADPMSQLQEMTFWMLGGLSGTTWGTTLMVLPLVAPALLILVLLRWRLSILSLDDLTAHSIGTSPARERLLLLVAASAATAGVTAAAGIIGWVGLLVPHVARRYFGVEGNRALPASLLLGAVMVVVCDTIARSLMVYEIPLGIITSLLGASLFLSLLSSGQVRFKR